MKQVQKLVLPLLLLAVIFIIYQFYFATGGLGSFDDFDPNNSAVKTITVKFINDVEPEHNIVFYVQDKNEKIIQVNTSSVLPDGFASAETVTLKGHLSDNSFHAHEILVD